MQALEKFVDDKLDLCKGMRDADMDQGILNRVSVRMCTCTSSSCEQFIGSSCLCMRIDADAFQVARKVFFYGFMLSLQQVGSMLSTQQAYCCAYVLFYAHTAAALPLFAGHS